LQRFSSYLLHWRTRMNSLDRKVTPNQLLRMWISPELLVIRVETSPPRLSAEFRGRSGVQLAEG
jgi:hypothetical protein